MYHYPVGISPDGGFVTEPTRGFGSLTAALEHAAETFPQPAHKWVMVITSERAATTPTGYAAGPLGGLLTLTGTSLYWPGGPATRRDLLTEHHVRHVVARLTGDWSPPSWSGSMTYVLVTHDGAAREVVADSANAARAQWLSKYPLQSASRIAAIVPLDPAKS